MVCHLKADAPLDPGQNERDTEVLRIATGSDRDSILESWQHDHAPENNNAAENKSIQAAIALIHGKWKIGILTCLRHGPLRLSQLCRILPGASKKMLTQHLREMEEDDLVVRSDRSTKIRHVEYSLSDSLGLPVLHLIDTLAQWDRQHNIDSSAKENGTKLSEEL